MFLPIHWGGRGGVWPQLRVQYLPQLEAGCEPRFAPFLLPGWNSHPQPGKYNCLVKTEEVKWTFGSKCHEKATRSHTTVWMPCGHIPAKDLSNTAGDWSERFLFSLKYSCTKESKIVQPYQHLWMSNSNSFSKKNQPQKRHDQSLMHPASAQLSIPTPPPGFKIMDPRLI